MYFIPYIYSNLKNLRIEMKRNFYLSRIMSIVALVAFALPLTSCDNSNDETPKSPEEFKIELGEITAFELTFTITPPTSTPTYTVKLMRDTSSLDVSDIELAASIVSDPSFTTYEGTQTLTIGGLVGESSYRLIYFAYDTENKKMLSDLFRSDVIRTPKSDDLFTITVENITGLGADITITPPDNEMTYYYFVEEKSDYETHFGNSDQGVINNDFSYWEFMASMYEGVSWLDLLEMSLCTGPQAVHTDLLYGSLEWDTEYFAYAYGVNKEGEITHPMTKKFFTTAAPEASDNSFDVELGDVVWNAEKMGFVAYATVTPSITTESYYAVITNKDWYDWYFSEYNTGRSDEDYIMYQLVLNCPSSAVALDECQTGVATISNEDWQTGLRPDKEYAVFVFGFGPNGATTGLTVVPFTTPSRPTE